MQEPVLLYSSELRASFRLTTIGSPQKTTRCVQSILWREQGGRYFVLGAYFSHINTRCCCTQSLKSCSTMAWRALNSQHEYPQSTSHSSILPLLWRSFSTTCISIGNILGSGVALYLGEYSELVQNSEFLSYICVYTFLKQFVCSARACHASYFLFFFAVSNSIPLRVVSISSNT